MASKQPWRTVILSEETGRFSREQQIDAAVMKAKHVREQRAARAAAPSSSGSAKQEA